MRKQFLTLTLIGAVAMILTTSCGGGSKSGAEGSAPATSDKPKPADNHYTEKDLVQKDLTADGINASILAPKDASVIWASDKREAYVYGGKFFKVTVYVADTVTSADENYELVKTMATNKELNPGFVKLADEKGTGFLKESKDNKFDFVLYVPRKSGSYHLSDGIPYDSSPDQSTEYTPADIKTEYAAARSFTAK
ncbi:MAG: hypothetical protein JWO03_1375 [Bacteroidetes bacterium]|nr:hypothetical protein [Bacteroidota bacterium]